MNIVDSLLKVALLGSEWVMYLLIALSVASFAAMLERFWYFRKYGDSGDVLRDGLADLLAADDLGAADQLLGKDRSVVARVVREAMRFRAGGPDAVSDAAESELGRVRPELERGLNLLGTLGNNAPFIGLFGTVIGVIVAFDQLGQQGNKAAAMGNVMSGIAEALVATGIGIFVAIPAVVAYNLVQKRIGEIEGSAQALIKLVTAYIKTKERAGLVPGSAAIVASVAAADDESETDEDLNVAQHAAVGLGGE